MVDARSPRDGADSVVCPTCGYEAADDFTFCPKCATRLASSAPSEERKTVTTLFCDLVAFTALSEAADPEDVDALLGRYHQAARAVIEDYGGIVEKFIGDAVVGVFGVPVVHEDDPERAVRAGLRIIEGMAGRTRPDGSPLQARVGINTGEALVRLDVDPLSGRGFLTGDAVNTAARFEAAAPPMGVVVGASTHAATQQAFGFEQLPPLTLKGKRGRVEAWLAAGPKAGREPRSSKARSGLIVGREAELARCENILAGLRDGRGGLLLITGEAGIGKTRLLEEVQGVAQREGCAWLEGRTLSFGRSISYWPFLEILQQDAGIEGDDDEAVRWEKLEARLGALFGGQAAELLPYLASLLGVSVPDEVAEETGHLDAEAMGRQIYRAMRLYVARLAAERPLVCVFEDVHWLDDSSAALLDHLLPLVPDVPLLVCCVARPELDTPLQHLEALAHTDYAELASELRLEPLSASNGAALVSQLVGTDRLPATLRSAILAKAEGNPFFVEEIVRSLIDLGGLVSEEAGGYRATAEAGRIAIPDTLLGVIMARIDRLDEDLKQVLRLASVIGRTFFYRLLAAISEADRDLDASLGGLQARDLVRELSREPELEYVFKHALVQEATYESIAKRRRRELHRNAAAAIESLFADRLEDFYSLLAYHYTRAEDWEKAQAYLFKAGDQAGAIAADAEALGHYERALEAYERAYGAQLEPLDLARVQRKMGEAYVRRGEHERGRAYLCRALAVLGHPYPTGPRQVRRALVVQVVRQLAHVVFGRWLTRRATALRRAVAEECCWVYYTLALSDVGGDQAGLLLALLLGLNEGERVGLDWAAAAFASVACYVCDLVPLRRLAGLYHRRTQVLAEKTRSPLALAHAHFFGGMHEAWASGDLDKAVEYLRRGRWDLRALGVTRNWAFASEVLASTLMVLGEWDEATAIAEELCTYGAETGDQVAVASGLNVSGRLRGLKGAL
ncbi:MAG TPA: AAA family ATPase, partial [Candidatus Dormibacteraeota bacterium]|nr:AAA family ATPase [Candidatus Dormibacteraeota bacterium]